VVNEPFYEINDSSSTEEDVQQSESFIEQILEPIERSSSDLPLRMTMQPPVQQTRPTVQEPVPVQQTRPPVQEPVTMQQTRPPVQEPVPMQQTRPTVQEPVTMQQTRPPVQEPVTMQQTRPPVQEPVTMQQTRPAVQEPVTMQQTRPPVQEPVPMQRTRPPVQEPVPQPLYRLPPTVVNSLSSDKSFEQSQSRTFSEEIPVEKPRAKVVAAPPAKRTTESQEATSDQKPSVMNLVRMIEARDRQQSNRSYSSGKGSTGKQSDLLVKININDPENILDGVKFESSNGKIQVAREQAPQESRPLYSSTSSPSRSYSDSHKSAKPVPQPEDSPPVVEQALFTPPEWSKESSKYTPVSSISPKPLQPQTQEFSGSGYYPHQSFMVAPETRLDPESSSGGNLRSQSEVDVTYMNLQNTITSNNFWQNSDSWSYEDVAQPKVFGETLRTQIKALRKPAVNSRSWTYTEEDAPPMTSSMERKIEELKRERFGSYTYEECSEPPMTPEMIRKVEQLKKAAAPLKKKERRRTRV